jgi:hypothetical protein
VDAIERAHDHDRVSGKWFAHVLDRHAGAAVRDRTHSAIGASAIFGVRTVGPLRARVVVHDGTRDLRSRRQSARV